MSLGQLSRRFNGADYTVSAAVSGDLLTVEVRQRSGGAWGSKFTARFVEEVTQRTGNFKTFAVFTKMLSSALSGDSSSVSLDVLTGEDLERIRSSQRSGISSTSQLASPEKRYVILTYQAEFDKVHYPLALSVMEAPAAASTQPLQISQPPCNGCSELQRQLTGALSRESSMRMEFSKLVDSFQNERDRMQGALGALPALTAAEISELSALRESNRFFEAELRALREGKQKTLTRHKQETDQLAHQVAALRHSERQLKLKVKQLESDLLAEKGRGGRGGRVGGGARQGETSPGISGRVRSVSPQRPVGEWSRRTDNTARSENSRLASSLGSPRRMAPSSPYGLSAPVTRVNRVPPVPLPSRSYGRSPSPSNYRGTTSPSHGASPSQHFTRSPRQSPESPARYRAPTEISRYTREAPRDPPPPPSAESSVAPDRSFDQSLRSVPGNFFSGKAASVTPHSVVDIKDIDARLQALQNFLRQTKLSGGG